MKCASHLISGTLQSLAPTSAEIVKFDLTHPQVDTDEYFLEKDYSIDCDSDTYKAVRVYALAMIAGGYRVLLRHRRRS